MDVWTFWLGMQFFLFSFLFFFPPGTEHNEKPLILYRLVLELDQKMGTLVSVPTAFPSSIFANPQRWRRNPWCGSTSGDGSETHWPGPAQQPLWLG